MVEPSTLCAINQEVLVPVPWTLGFFTLISHLSSLVSGLRNLGYLPMVLSSQLVALGFSAFHLPLSSNLKTPWGLNACLSEIDRG